MAVPEKVKRFYSDSYKKMPVRCALPNRCIMKRVPARVNHDQPERRWRSSQFDYTKQNPMYTHHLFGLFAVIVVCTTLTLPILSHQCSPSEPRNDCCSLRQWSQPFQEAWFDVQFYCLFTADFSFRDSSRNVFPLCMENNAQNVVNGQKKQDSVSLVLSEFELRHCFGHYVANSPGDRVQFLESRDELVRKIEICGCFDPANRWTPVSYNASSHSTAVA